MPTQPGNRGRVLLAEDDPDNGLLLSRLLAHLGFEVAWVSDGREALDRAIEGGWDLVMTDIEMPSVDGIELARALRAHEASVAGDRVPVVAVTAHVLDAFRDRAVQAGMDGFLEKPIELATLEAATAGIGAAPDARSPARDPDAGSGRDPGRDVVAVDPDLVDLVPSFLARRRAELPLLEGHLAAGDFPAIARVAHGVAATARGFGFERLEGLGRALESAASDGDVTRAGATLAALGDHLGRVVIVPAG